MHGKTYHQNALLPLSPSRGCMEGYCHNVCPTVGWYRLVICLFTLCILCINSKCLDRSTPFFVDVLAWSDIKYNRHLEFAFRAPSQKILNGSISFLVWMLGLADYTSLSIFSDGRCGCHLEFAFRSLPFLELTVLTPHFHDLLCIS